MQQSSKWLLVGSALSLACLVGCGDSTNGGFDDDAGGGDSGVTADSGGGSDAGGGSDGSSGDAATGDGSFCATHADGTACGDASSSDCDKPDTCKAGVCAPNLTAVDTTCGGTPTECTEQGKCDGKGKCNGPPKAQGVACGDSSTTACDAPDTCDGQGMCLPNHAMAGTACGSATPTDPECDMADTCDANGVCQLNHVANGTACGSTSATSCDGADTCLDGACATNAQPDGMTCTDCASGIGKCGLCATGACPDLCTMPNASSLSTTFAAGNGQQGNMFDVVGLADAMVLGMTLNADTAEDFAVYTRGDTVVGHDTSATGWTQVATGSTATSGQTDFVGDMFIPIFANATTGFYVTTVTGSGVSYTNGTAAGNVYAQDGVMQILEGYGKSYPFGATFSPRIWNGTMKYAPGTTTSYAGTGASEGEMFDVVATADANVRALSVNLDPGPYTVHVYFHIGTHVGVEGMSNAWTEIGSKAITSLAAGAPTAVTLPLDITIPNGKTYSFYVTTEGGGTSMKDATGTAVGTDIVSGNNVTVKEGTGVAYPFGTTTTPRVFNGTLYVSSCP